MSAAILTSPMPIPIPSIKEEPWVLLERAIKARPAAWAEEEVRRLSKLFPIDDGEPMESAQHRANMNLMIDVVLWNWRHRQDYHVGGNNFVHYSPRQLKNREFLGPDFFVVVGTDFDMTRDTWTTWLENNKFPDLIIEFASPSTVDKDLNEKKGIYEQTFRTKEYFSYDTESGVLLGWRLQDDTKSYQKLAFNADSRLESEVLSAYLGRWQGAYQGVKDSWLRLFDAKGNLLLTETEATRLQAETEKKRAEEEEKLKLDALSLVKKEEKLKLDALSLVKKEEKLKLDAQTLAETEKKRADKAEGRADKAEKELENLRRLLSQLPAKANGSQTS